MHILLLSLLRINTEYIIKYVGRHIPFGNEVKQSVAALPRFDLQIEQVSPTTSPSILFSNFALRMQTGKTDHGANLVVHVKRINDPKVSNFNCWQLLVGDATNNLVYHKRFR
jgi:hypothetical protein